MSKYEPLGKDLFAELFVIACKEGEIELNTSREETDHLYDQTFYHWFESDFAETESSFNATANDWELWNIPTLPHSLKTKLDGKLHPTKQKYWP